jgi:hypothetical protein
MIPTAIPHLLHRPVNSNPLFGKPFDQVGVAVLWFPNFFNLGEIAWEKKL